jgi:hypothetical protein
MNSPNRATIVVGVDGSTSALHAALWAADEAAQRHHRFSSPSQAIACTRWCGENTRSG